MSTARVEFRGVPGTGAAVGGSGGHTPLEADTTISNSLVCGINIRDPGA